MHKKLGATACIVCCVALLGGGMFSGPEAWGRSIKVKDAQGSEVLITSTQRIVSLNGTVTETLFALGVGKHLVGRDSSSYYPPQVTKIPTVGYQYKLNAEGILRLRPTLVIGLHDVKPRFALEQIKGAGVAVLLVKSPRDIATSQAMIRTLGRAVRQSQKAQQLIAEMDRDLRKLAMYQAQWKGKSKPRVMSLYVRGHRMRFVLGRETSVGGMLRLVGATNVARFRRVMPMSAESVLVARPDVIVIFTKGLQSIGGFKRLHRLPGISLTPAGKHRRYVVMDDLYLGGFGPRCAKAALDLFRGIFEANGTFVAQTP